MAIFKCKMCGGALEINNNETVATCEYCGTQQTLPKLDDDRKANLYDRANHFRRNNEFDKAMGIYEQILNEDNSDAESYWSLVLCRYGIEYVEDPSSHKRVPTVNRAQFTSVFDDEDYKSALKYADGFQKEVYEAEAKVINEIQKGILAISQQEEPFDVFICYKETDSNGRRTQDSVIATELYHELTREGYKVFFSRITLEDKLGTAYEPYIFAAINSSKVMVVLGTKPEYFNAVWVKNEWSRYLSLIKNGEKKILIPAYRDMDPYDLPEEFSHLQAQDMTKLGFMQDLIRGINKLVKTEEPQPTVVKETVVKESANGNVTSLLKRGFMALEDSEWNKADDFFEQTLNFDAELAEAYLGKLMAELKVCKQDELKNCEQPFDDKNNFKKAIRFSDKELAETLTGYVTFINDRNHTAKMNSLYAEAMKSKNAAKTKIDFDYAAEKFKAISDWKDAKEQYEECLKKAKEAAETAAYNEKLEKYNKACNEMDTHTVVLIEDRIGCVEKAKKTFATIIDFKDSEKKIAECDNLLNKLYDKQKRIEAENQQKAEIARKEAKKRKKRIKKIALIVSSIICLIIVLIILINSVIIPAVNYNNAVKLMQNGSYNEAIATFEVLDGYKDSLDKINECKNGIAESKYNNAIRLMNEGKYQDAIVQFEVLNDYKDSIDKINICIKEVLNSVNIGDYLYLGKYEQDGNTSNGKEIIEWLILDKQENKLFVISKDVLITKEYNETRKDVTWETCTLRQWLNNDFINSAFSAEEQTMIPTVTVSADKNPEYNTNPGNDTQDKVFLLSIKEANNYFKSDNERLSNRSWWLRSPGGMQDDAAFVTSYGSISNYGVYVYTENTGVRPTIWISIPD